MFKHETMSLELKELRIKNFKCFKEEKKIAFEKLTILTGANSSGKSSILHSVLGPLQSSEFPYKFSTNGKFVKMGDFKEISNGHDEKNEIEIGFSFKDIVQSKPITYHLNTVWVFNKSTSLPTPNLIQLTSDYFDLKIKKSEEIYLLDFSYSPQNDPSFTPEKSSKIKEEIITDFISRKTRRSKEQTKEQVEKEIKSFIKYVETLHKKVNKRNVKIESLDKLKETAMKCRNTNLNYAIDILLTNMCLEYNNNINVISSFRLHPDRTYLEQSSDNPKIDKFGDGYLDQIVAWEKTNPAKCKELTKILNTLTLAHSISAHRIEGGRFEVQVTIKKNGTKTSLFDVGFGISQFVPIIVADLQLTHNSTLYVAEPEIHLHPSVQAKFGDYVVEQISRKNKNYVIETHSEYFLNRIRLAVVKGSLKPENLAVYYLENEGMDVSVYPIKFGERGQIDGAPKSFFDTYLMDIRDIALNIK